MSHWSNWHMSEQEYDWAGVRLLALQFQKLVCPSCCCTILLYHPSVPSYNTHVLHSSSLPSYSPTFLVHYIDELMYFPARPASAIQFECNTVPFYMYRRTEVWMYSLQKSCHFRSVYQGNPIQVLPYFQQLVQPVLSIFPPGWSWGI